MIPTIETIVEDLAAGKITKQQAIAWLYQHAEEAGYCLRAELAKCAMQGILAKSFGENIISDVCEKSYEYADAMISVGRRLLAAGTPAEDEKHG